MGELIRSMDWSRTPLGPIESWPPTLRTMVSLLLANRFPLLLWWGPDYVQIYNDAYRPIPGAKHPRSMGQPARECWTEIWPIIGPLIDTPYHGGPPTWNDDILLVIDRRGFLEETHFTIAYSPVPDATASGGIGGVLATVHEITAQVIQARRVAVLRDLGARSSEAKTAEEACAIAAEAFERHALDVPFALLYLVDADGRTARLAGVCPGGGGVHESFAPPVVSLEAGSPSPWPLAEAFATERVQVVDDLDRCFPIVPSGPWPDPPRQALVLPVSSIPQKMAGLLVFGVSARNPLDDGYRGFFELATAQVASALANARAYEEERRRAEALAEIDRAKTVFFSNVSHEFRTPLALMLAPLEDALEDAELPLAPAHRERLVTAHRNSLRLLKLVNTLLDFSRIEAGRIEAYYEPTDLPALTSDLASNFRSAMDRAGLRLVVDCPPLPEAVHVDRDMWEKIVLNLLSNAFKFTLDGEIAVTLRSTGNAVELAVRDTGSGIASEEIPRLFERFYRPKGGRARTHEGTGIGLSLVQELVRLHGGAVRVESAPGVGSTFAVSIPAVTPGVRDQLAPRTLASTALGARPFVEEALRWLPDVAVEARPQFRAATARILLADDNADMREYVSRLLRAHWIVDAVADGRAALETARVHAPDLVLTDVMMPGLDGFELLRALRDDPRTATIPVILLSARAGEEARVEGLQAGADDYVVKPFTARELVARVRTHLALARIRADVARQAEEARTEAEAASSAKDLFLATLSHELRQPLTSIVGWLRLLQRADTDAGEQGSILQRLERSVGSLTRLIDDLLDVSSIVTGKMRLNLQPVDLRQSIEAAMDTVRASATAKSIKLESTLDPGTPLIVGDADRLQQVVWNLLSNAVKFTPDGGRISVRLERDGALATVRVTDSGRGINAEFMPRLFDRFSQAAAGGRRALPGLGLGLAIARHLVELHGGTITAESPGENQGATFIVALPIPAGQPDAAAIPQRSTHAR